MKNRMSFLLSVSLLTVSILCAASVRAQDVTEDQGALPTLPTLFSVRLSGGWGIGRARQLYGYNGAEPVWWSTGQGAKINLALDLPIIPIDVVDSSIGSAGTSPVIGLELEAGTGYHLSTGGTTNDQIGTNGLLTTTRTTSYIPITLGLNARSSFGAGLPSVYIGVGGGIYLVGIYQESVSGANAGTGFSRKMNPPVPFGLYGSLGFELPLLYDPDAGNSMFDLFLEARLTEMTSYIYDYDVSGQPGTQLNRQNPLSDNTMFLHDQARSASNVSLSLGFKFNLY